MRCLLVPSPFVFPHKIMTFPNPIPSARLARKREDCSLIPAVALFASVLSVGHAAPANSSANGPGTVNVWPEQRIFRYDAPAIDWLEALPVGNGRLGAMVFGAYPNERIQLNEDSLWAIDPLLRHPAETKDRIAEVQELVNAGKLAEADALYREKVIMGKAGLVGSYQTMGDLAIEHVESPAAAAGSWHRQLDLATGVATTRLVRTDGTVVTQHVVASAVDDCIVIRLETTASSGLSFDVSLTRPTMRNASALVQGDDTLKLEQHNRTAENDSVPSTSFRTLLKVSPEGGSVSGAGNRLQVRGANAATLLITCVTDFDKKTPRTPLPEGWQNAADTILAKAAAKPWSKLLADSAGDLSSLMYRCDLEIGTSPESVGRLPTSERIKRLATNEADPDLFEIYFHYSRYLLASSSRPGTLPANLQGLWADKMENPWQADYHLNINIQMNYWLAGMTGLAECEQPLFWLLDALRPEGRLMARAFGAEGFCAPHAVNPWARCVQTAPQVRWGGNLTGAQWVAFHLMEHYRFTGDRAFLRETAEPILRESCEFVMSWVVRNPKTGKWVGKASASHEVGFVLTPEAAKVGRSVEIGLGPATAYDLSIFWQVLSDYLEAAGDLGIENDFTRRVRATLEDLETPRIGSMGQILEWGIEVLEHEPHHRHLSHLIGLHPGSQITPDRTPALFEAAKVSLINRGPGSTGWSHAARACLYARILNGDTALTELTNLVGKSMPNLMGKGALLDGNCGATAAMVEFLLQSHERSPDGTFRLDLLPALPAKWPEGSVRGLRARGGFIVDLDWAHGKVTRYRITSAEPRAVNIRVNGETKTITSERSAGSDPTGTSA